MYNKRINYIAVGLFVLAMAAAGLGSIALLTGRTGPADRYFVALDNVADIKFGTQVRYEGLAIGQVEGIAPVAEVGRPRFRVELGVRQGWRIPRDSVTRIASSSFLGAKTLDIAAGQSDEPIPLGGEIAGAGPSDMFTTMSAAASQVTALSEGSIQPLLETMQSLAETLERDTPRITGQLAAFSERLNVTLVSVQAILAQDNVEAIRRTIANAEGTTENLARASLDLTATMQRISSLAANLDDLVANNDAGVEQTLKDLQYTLASMARSVDTIVHNFDGTARNMNEFSRLIRANPGLLLGGSPRPAVAEAKADGSTGVKP